MCGIIAVLRRPAERAPADSKELLTQLDAAASVLAGTPSDLVAALGEAADGLAAVDRALRGVPGVIALLNDGSLPGRIRAAVDEINDRAAALESNLDEGLSTADDLETLNSAFSLVKDGCWAINKDRLRAAREVTELVGSEAGPSALAVGLSLHQALSAIDRLEVRGRDSAGVEVIVWNHGLDPADAGVAHLLNERSDLLFTSGSVRLVGDSVAFVYKASAEIGELGDNTAALRAAIRADELLALALMAPTAEAVVVGHTRWASVGIISESNAHPQSSDESGRDNQPFVTAVLNGDVDNFADLIASESLVIPPLVTTDAKVIPTVMSRRLAAGLDPAVAFRETVGDLEGSVAIAAHHAGEPGRVYLALRGSGQALYVGVAEDTYLVASEPYGVVEETDRFLRVDGETPSDLANPTASRGQVLRLDSELAGTAEGIGRWSYDGTELPVTDGDLSRAEITTRDIDRGDFPHFLLKEITDSPSSFRKTLRGKLLDVDGQLSVVLGDSTIPSDVRADLEAGRIDKIVVIGQGTAAAAGNGLAASLSGLLVDTPVRVEAVLATELSGFRLRPDMTDTLVIAISQSGTTTDTNRTVDLARGRGARVIAVVNRRNSDLCDKSDGVLYTSDGRDVEMSVASTKAFYAQIAAGLLLAYALADHVPGALTSADPGEQALLAALRDLPDLMEQTIARRDQIAAAARQFGPSRRYWAIVGNGMNSIAAREIRIKLSELCYKSIACDATEDKKHIDLSSEPLILICAAGLSGSTAADVGKEVEIYRAHKAAPIVIASDGAQSFGGALHVISVPDTESRLAFVLSAMAGHLFGYEAALAIDAQAQPLREARVIIEQLIAELQTADASKNTEPWRLAQKQLQAPSAAFLDGLRAGSYNGHLEASSAVRVASSLRYATGVSGLDAYQSEFGKVGTPGVVLDDLMVALTAAIEELTRPVDAIKHQAKTVTVGISRSDESLLVVPLVAETLAAGAPRDRLSYATLRSLADLDAAVEAVLGSTRYRVEDVNSDLPTATVVDRAGIAASLPSRTDRDPRLRGTKHLVAREQELMVARGRSDGRIVVIVPETKDGETTGLTLLHLRLPEHLTAGTARNVMSGYRRRYQALRDHVTETEDVFREDLLAEQPVLDLLCEPIVDLADRWKSEQA